MLPDKADNPIEIKVHPKQIDAEDGIVDPRIFSKTTFSVLYGARFTGKTILLTNLIHNFYLPKRAFPGGIMILTPSGHDKAWNLVRNRSGVYILKKCNDDLLFDLIDSQEAALKEGRCRHMLLVIDDFASQGKGLRALEELAIRGRHLKLTIIVTTQYSKLLPPVIRRNCNGAVLFKMDDIEIEELGREGLRCSVSTQEFVDWVKEHTKVPRSFVYINLRDEKRPFRIGFS